MSKKIYAASAAILLALVFFAGSVNVSFAKTCDGGLLKDCGMEGFYGDEGAGSGVWKISRIGGSPQISLHPVEGWPSGPSVWMQGSAPFEAAIYQQVQVTPGHGYCLSIPFAVVALDGVGMHDGPVVRKVGIDTLGGTDPNAGSITWSPDFTGKGRFDDDQLKVCEYAHAAVITAYIRVINQVDGKHVDVYLDSPALVEDTGMTPIQVNTAPTAAPTSVPPTEAPTKQVVPTDAPAIEPTDAPTDVASATAVAPTPTERVEPTATELVVPTKLALPTRTRAAVALSNPRPTRARADATQNAASDSSNENSGAEFGTLAVIGLAGISGAILMGIVAAVLLLRRK